MTYILNAIPIGSREPRELTNGRIIAELDDPPTAFLKVDQEVLIGVHYLLVTDNGSGYRSSIEFTNVPRHSEQPTTMSVPDALRTNLHRILETLLLASPERRMALYLEANRAISREDPEEPFPTRPTLIFRYGLKELWEDIDRGAVEEDEVRIIHGR